MFTRAQLLDAIHGEAFEAYERAIDAHVKNIRRKLEPDPRAPRYLLTVIGVGYRLADDRMPPDAAAPPAALVAGGRAMAAERWPPGPGGPRRHGPPWGVGWGRGGSGVAFAASLVLRALGVPAAVDRVRDVPGLPRGGA